MANNRSEFLFKNINIIGLGLIGGSLAKACQKYKIAESICGFDIDATQTDIALTQKIISGKFDLNKPVSDDDLVIICTPLSCYKKIFQDIALTISEKTLIIDIGSLKDFTLQLAEKTLLDKAANFIPCHPIAGSEKSGVINSDGDLFFDKKIILTPSKINSPNQIRKAQLFWHKIGSLPQFLDAKEHDKIFALVSHLPQFLSFIAQENFTNGDDEILNKHFRLQNSNPKIWQEIFTLNRKNLEYYLQFYLENIDKILNNLIDTNSLISRRIALVSCFLNLPDIENFKSFSGTGFKDFTSIINHPKNQTDPHKHESLSQFLNQIKSKIISYEFK